MFICMEEIKKDLCLYCRKNLKMLEARRCRECFTKHKLKGQLSRSKQRL